MALLLEFARVLLWYICLIVGVLAVPAGLFTIGSKKPFKGLPLAIRGAAASLVLIGTKLFIVTLEPRTVSLPWLYGALWLALLLACAILFVPAGWSPSKHIDDSIDEYFERSKADSSQTQRPNVSLVVTGPDGEKKPLQEWLDSLPEGSHTDGGSDRG